MCQLFRRATLNEGKCGYPPQKPPKNGETSVKKYSELVSMKSITELKNIRYKMNSVRHEYRRQTPTSNKK